ncbi:hypothetical protein F3Y22_tig00110057pilonHSYRG00238 [Hibiscus syriacus]|uniref:Uncharacterized protein n=1 Tax=Hibiscus syriacus TaxID=106335 RepID=A0A6A3BKV9_HIBSY|nr:hypothetical protein F3Y22_tig00110057pilonHSYRG00238 [Hibiscus syriacus]
MPQHLLIQMLKACSTLLLAEMSLQECPNIHIAGSSRTKWYKSLGNTFQTDTVAYHLLVLRNVFPKGTNVLSFFSGIVVTEVALYRLDIPLKADVQELNDDRLEQLMSRFGGFDIVAYKSRICSHVLFCAISPQIQVQQSSEGHNGYNPNKENDQHGRSSNDVSRLEPVSRYNQSAGGGLVHSHNTPNETYGTVIGGSVRRHGLMAGKRASQVQFYRFSGLLDPLPSRK